MLAVSGDWNGHSVPARHFVSGPAVAPIPLVTRNFCLPAVALFAAMLPRLAFCEESSVPFLDQLRGEPPKAVSGNPAAESRFPETRADRVDSRKAPGQDRASSWRCVAGRHERADLRRCPARQMELNSALIVGADLDAEKLICWKGASFGIEFLQFNGEDTNGQAGSVQGYNSLPGPPPLDRSELYQVWYRQSLFDDGVIFRIGKVVPTFDFNNVARPVPTQDEGG